MHDLMSTQGTSGQCTARRSHRARVANHPEVPRSRSNSAVDSPDFPITVAVHKGKAFVVRRLGEWQAFKRSAVHFLREWFIYLRELQACHVA